MRERVKKGETENEKGRERQRQKKGQFNKFKSHMQHLLPPDIFNKNFYTFTPVGIIGTL